MGTWAPAYQAQFAKPLVNQAIAIIQRDQAGALGVVNAARAANGNAALPPIEEFHKGPGMRQGFPWLFLEIGPSAFARGDDRTTRHSQVRVILNLDTGQYDTEMAQEDAHDYGRMLDMIVTTAGPWPSLADWTAPLPIAHETVPDGVTTPNAVGSVGDCFVESHVPGRVSVSGIDVPVMRIALTIVFELDEV